MDQQKGYYRQLRELTNSFFEENLPLAIREFIAKKKEPFLHWFTDTYSAFLKVKKDDPQRQRKIVKELNERMPLLRDLLKDAEPGASESWLQDLKKIVATLPENIEEESSPDRFEALEKDSTAVRIKKMVKRSARKFPGGPKVAYQIIPLRNIVESVLLESTYVRKEIVGEGYLMMVNAFDLILETETEPDEVTEGKKYTDNFRIDQVEHIETHLQEAIQLLKNGIEPDEAVMQAMAKEAIGRAEKADTTELRSSRFEDAVINKKRLRYTLELDEYEKEWEKYLQSQFADFNIQLELGTYGLEVAEGHKNILDLTHEYFRDFCYLPLEGAVSYVKEIKGKIDESRLGNVLSKSQTKKIQTEVRSEFADEILENIRNTDLQEDVVTRIGKEVSRMQFRTGIFTESITLPKERKVENLVPYTAFDTIRWRALATRFFKENAVRELDPADSELGQFIDTVRKEIEEALRIVDVNLSAALESADMEEEAAEESPLEIAMNGLDRSAKLLEETIKRAREKQNSYEEIVHEKLPTALHKLSDYMMNRAYGEFVMQDKALQVKEQAMNWQNRFLEKWSVLTGKVNLGRRFLKKRTAAIRSTLSRYLGLSGEESVSLQRKRSLSEELSKETAHKDLPFVYRSIFKNDFTIDERFYVVPLQGDQLYRNAFDAWVSEKTSVSNVLFVGEKGSGKSTSAHFFLSKYSEEHPVVTITLEHTIYSSELLLKSLCDAFGFKKAGSVEEFAEKIKRRKQKKAIVQFENLQNLFVRNIHGFEALEVFWHILSLTSKELFWTVTISRYSWNFIKKISGADQYFTHIIDVDTLDKEKIRQAILARHRATGYDLHFVENMAIQKTRTFRKRETDPLKLQETQEDLFFEKLSKLAEGNMSIAIMFWLQSIKKVEKNTFYISPIEVTDVDKLEVPSREVLFTLASLVIHDRLSTAEMAMSLHQPEVQSRLMITRLKSKGMVVEKDNSYSLNQMVYRQVIRLLKRRNIIH